MAKPSPGCDVRVTHPEDASHPRKGQWGKVIAVTTSAAEIADGCEPTRDIVWVEFRDIWGPSKGRNRLPFWGNELTVSA